MAVMHINDTVQEPANSLYDFQRELARFRARYGYEFLPENFECRIPEIMKNAIDFLRYGVKMDAARETLAFLAKYDKVIEQYRATQAPQEVIRLN